MTLNRPWDPVNELGARGVRLSQSIEHLLPAPGLSRLMFLDEFIDDFYRKLGTDCGLGSQHVIGLKAVNRQSGDLLAEAQQQAVGKEGVLKALDTAAVSLRSKLGESLSTVKEYATPLAEATTSSLEALKMREFPRLNSSPRPEAFYVDDISRRLRGIG